LDLQSFSFEFGAFSFAFLECPVLPPAPTTFPGVVSITLVGGAYLKFSIGEWK